MSKTDKFEYNLQLLTFNGTGISSYASSAGTTSWWIGLHTADPGDAGSTANEGGYAAYTRIRMDRSSGAAGWSVSSGTSAALASASPVSNVDFPANSATSTGTFTFATLNPSSDSTGPGALYVGAITPNINFSNGVTPRLTTASAITED